MKTTILYFSGTGNSFALAYKVSKAFPNGNLVKISKNIDRIDTNRIILVTPTYAYGLPRIVYNFLKKTNIKCEEFYMVATCGTIPGGIFYQVYRLLKKQNIVLTYYKEVSTVENYFAIFKRDSEDVEKEKLVNQEVLTLKIINDINSKKTSTKPKRKSFLRIISFIFRHFLPIVNIPIRLKKKECNQCLMCLKNCPSNAITYDGNYVKINRRICENCQGCINRCPRKAILFLKVKKNTPRYLHPIYKEGLNYGEHYKNSHCDE